MSYNEWDILRDHGALDMEVEQEGLLSALREYFTKKNAERIWDLAGDWELDHFVLPEYAKGVYRGLVIAAKELDGMR